MRGAAAVVPPATLLLAATLAAACAIVGERRASVRPTAFSPELLHRQYAALAKAGQPVFEVDPARSVVVIEVRRAGSLAHLGHDHVVASRDIHGFIAPGERRADLYVGLAGLSVDDPGLRAAAGFDTRPSPADVAATRRNLLDEVLRVDEHPFAVAAASAPRPEDGAGTPLVSLTLNGVIRPIDVEATIEAAGDAMRITGRTTILQSDYGIVPFSILGGAIQVRDAITVHIEIHARRFRE